MNFCDYFVKGDDDDKILFSRDGGPKRVQVSQLFQFVHLRNLMRGSSRLQ